VVETIKAVELVDANKEEETTIIDR
jgi:hypothetical protein